MAIRRALYRLLKVMARPARADRGRGGLVIQPYRGYGSRREVFIMGRVFHQPGLGAQKAQGARRDLLDILRRLLRWGVGDAVLAARLGEARQRVEADRDGYFRIRLPLDHPPPADSRWHRVTLELEHPPGAASTEAQVFIPPADARYVVISDIDDTVMHTGVANKVMMIWRLFVQSADSRVAFPGVGALYQALYRGSSGRDHNPLLYVSRGPWMIYDVLERFFHLQGIPAGPILFLREWGLTLQRPLPRRAENHKLDLIREMLTVYEDLPFVLIGDSGQHDPEIYAQVVREHPGRVQAIYIRNVNHGDASRRQAIEELAGEVLEAGSSLVLAADSFVMAEHAVEHGLIAPTALEQVLEGCQALEAASRTHKATRHVRGGRLQGTRQAIARGELEVALEEETDQDRPPNVVVESGRRDTPPPGN